MIANYKVNIDCWIELYIVLFNEQLQFTKVIN